MNGRKVKGRAAAPFGNPKVRGDFFFAADYPQNFGASRVMLQTKFR